MKMSQRITALVLTASLLSSSLPAQCGESPECDECGCAYVESSRSAHWSIYIPIVVVVGAAIWFGLADDSSEKISYGSQDGLGSIDNSMRQISSYSSSGHNGYHRAKVLKGGYSH